MSTLTRSRPRGRLSLLPQRSLPAAGPRGSLRLGGVGLLALGAALLANSVAGPLVTGWLDYPISDSMLNQLLGLEVVTALLVVPATVVAGVLAIRGHPLAPLLGFGPSAYAGYMFIQYVLGPQYLAYSLTVLSHIGITGLAIVLALWCWQRAASLEVPRATGASRWRRACWLGFLALFVASRYAPTVIGAPGGQPVPAEFAQAPTFYWSIVLLDLGVVVPLTVLAAVAVLRGSRTGAQGYYAVVGWFTLVPPSVAAMAAVMVACDDPHASSPTLLMLSAASLLFAGPAVAAIRGFRRSSESVITTARSTP